MKKLIVAVTILLFASALWAGDNVNAGDIIITEIMADPTGSDLQNEWFEIYNASNSTIDINGWEILEDTEAPGGGHTINNGGPLNIAPGGFLVIGRTSAPSLGYDMGGTGVPSLNNGGDVISLYDGDGIVTSITYGSATENSSFELNNRVVLK